MSIRLMTIVALGAICAACLWAEPTSKALYESWITYQRAKQGTLDDEDVTTAAATIGFYLGYVQGTADSFAAAGKASFSLPQNADPEQLAFVVGKYLENHPAEWSDRAPLLIVKALRLAFPAR
jgi:hypothetical protein